MAIVIGCIIGLVLGLTGSGGSILAVPLFILFLQLSPLEAIGLSLGVVAASALLGVIGNLKTKNIQWLPALVFATIGSAFTPLGHLLAKNLPHTVIMSAFSLLILVVAAIMWRKAKTSPEETKVVRAGIYQSDNTQGLCRMNDYQPFKLGLPCIAGVSGGAVLTGVLSGLFGVGGGFVIVPTLIFLLGISIQQAVATSLLVISFVSTAGFINYALSTPEINFQLLTQIIMGGAIGMLLGLSLSKLISGPILQRVFVVIMFLLALIMLAKEFS